MCKRNILVKWPSICRGRLSVGLRYVSISFEKWDASEAAVPGGSKGYITVIVHGLLKSCPSQRLQCPPLLPLTVRITIKMSTTATTTVQEPITAANVIRLFPDVQSTYPPSHRSQSTSTADNELAGYDEEQIKLMDEVCIVLDNDDNPIGSASKKTCTGHLMLFLLSPPLYLLTFYNSRSPHDQH